MWAKQQRRGQGTKSLPGMAVVVWVDGGVVGAWCCRLRMGWLVLLHNSHCLRGVVMGT